MSEPLPIADVIQRAGGTTAIARACGVSKATPYSWRRVPPEHVPAISGLTGIPAHHLRPDLPQLFPAPADEAVS